jgi:hypothetical protein
MQAFWNALLADGRIADDEREVLAVLGDPTIPEIHVMSISPSGTNVELRFTNKLHPDASARAAELRQTADDFSLRLEQLWQQGEDTPAIYREFMADDDRRAALGAFLRKLAARSWAESSAANQYKPFQLFVGSAYARAQTSQPQLAPEEKRAAFVLLHDALANFAATLPPGQRLDQTQGEYFFRWLKNAVPEAHTPPAPDADPDHPRR